MADLPIEDQFSQDIPVEELSLPATEQAKTILQSNDEAVQATSMRVAQEGLDPIEAWTDVTGNVDISTAYETQKNAERDQQKRVIAEAYQEELSGADDPALIQDTTQVVRDMVHEVNIEEERLGGKYMPYLRAISGEFGTQESIEQEAVLQELRAQVAEAAGDLTALDIGRDLLIGLVPGGIIKDSFDITAGRDDITAREVLERMVVTFKNSDPQKQRELFPIYKEFLFENLEETQAVVAIKELLDPANEAETPSDFSAFWQIFDIADTAFTSMTAIHSANKLIKQTNAIRTAKRQDNEELASIINDIALSDKTGQASDIITETRVDAADNAAGMATTPEYTAGLNLAARARIEGLRRKTEELNEAIARDEVTNPEPILTQRAQAKASEAKQEEFEQVRQGFVDQGAMVSDTRKVSQDERSVTFEFDYDYRTVDGPSAGTQRVTYKYGIDDVGSLEDLELRMMPGLRSPLGIYKGEAVEIAEAGIRLEDQAAAVKATFDNLVAEALAPITKGLKARLSAITGNRSARKVEKILQSGDASGRAYTAAQLRAGVDGIKLTDKEIEAYFNLRTVYDGIWWADNNAQRAQLVSRGFKSTSVDGTQLYVQPLKAERVLSSTAKAYDPSTGQLVTLEGQIDKIYGQGRSVAKVDGFVEGYGGRYTHVIVDDAAVTAPGRVVKAYRKGYVPRIREKGLYYVKTSRQTAVDGLSVKAFGAGSKIKTIRSFDTRKQAEAFAERYGATVDDGSEVRVLQDRELEAEGVSVQGLGTGGQGTFTGSRSSEKILHGTDGEDAVLLNPLEAMARNVSYISNKLTRAEWRTARMQEWINTANRHLDSEVTDFNHQLPNTEVGKALERLRDDIKIWGRIEDRHESDLGSALQKVFEYAVDSKFVPRQLADAARWLKQKDPVSQVRGAAFHLLLGWFNPIQLFMQSQGAAVALSIAPTLAPRALLRQTALSMVENVTNADAIAKTAKRLGMDPEDLSNIKNLYEKTGLGKAIRANADITDSLAGGTSSLTGLADKGLVFYRMGEGFSRRTAFNIALEEFVRANKGKTYGNITDAELRRITTRANDFLLNLNKGNAANWQRGILSIPTQFMQVTAKAWGNMMPQILGGNARFTPVEKAKLLLGQTTLYGMAGLPLGMAMSKYMAQSAGVTQEDLDNLTPEAKAFLNGGMESLFFYSIFGEELVVGQRASLASGIDGVKDLLLERRMPIYESLAGPSGTAFKRSKEVYDKFAAITLDLNDPDVTLEQAGEAFKQLGGIASSSRNLQKAWDMWYNGWIIDRKSNLVASDFNTAESVAVSLGFQLQREADIRSMGDMVKSKRDLVNNTGKMMRDATLSFLRHGDELTPGVIRTYESIKNALISNPSFTDKDREEIKNKHAKFLKDILTKNTKEARALQKMVQDYVDAIPEDFLAITGAGAIQIMSNEQVESQVFKNYLEDKGDIK